jgi:hypothetical protein
MKYIGAFTTHHQRAGDHNISNKHFVNVTKFMYLETTVGNKKIY